MKFEFSRQIFERKMLKYKISRKVVQWESRCSMRTDRQMDGRADRRDEAVSRFSQFCEGS
jgi:hypothetical protein